MYVCLYVCMFVYIYMLYTLPETSSLPLKIGRAPKGIFMFQLLVFRGYFSFRDGVCVYIYI